MLLVWFRRELPFPPERLAADPPRLRDAKALLTAGAVTFRDDGEAVVDSAEKRYAVRLDPARCSWPWWSKHPGDRGPCKHLLAARLAAAQRVPAR